MHVHCARGCGRGVEEDALGLVQAAAKTTIHHTLIATPFDIHSRTHPLVVLWLLLYRLRFAAHTTLHITSHCRSHLKLGHLTAYTSLKFLRHEHYEQEGWRVIKANDTLPPNLEELQVTDCDSATPLLALSQLTALSILTHSNTPAAELKRLSSLTGLQTAALGHTMYCGGGGEYAACEASAGWGFVPALHSLQVHIMEIDPAGNMLRHLAGLTGLTRLVWDCTRCEANLDAWVMKNTPFEDFVFYRDGGLHALAAALPSSLRVLELREFMPAGEQLEECAVLMSLSKLMKIIAALPHLTDVIVECELYDCGYSEQGKKLYDLIMSKKGADSGGDDDDAVFEAVFYAYPEYFMTELEDDEDEDGESDGDGGGSSGDDDEGGDGDGGDGGHTGSSSDDDSNGDKGGSSGSGQAGPAPAVA